MLTLPQYPAAIAKYGENNLTDNQRKAHDIIVEGSANYQDWDLLDWLMKDEPAIKTAVEKWLSRLHELTHVAPSKDEPKHSDKKSSITYRVGDNLFWAGNACVVKEIIPGQSGQWQRYKVKGNYANGESFTRTVWERELSQTLQKRKKPTEVQRKRAATVAKRGTILKRVKKSQGTDASSFAQRMKAARDAKKLAKKEPVIPKAKIKKEGKTTKTPKTAKTAKLTTTDQAYLSADKYVNALPVEVKHFRKYVKLAESGTKEQLIQALNALQRDIRKGAISKTSPSSGMLMLVQKEYIDLLDAGRSPYKPSKHLAEIKTLAEGVVVYKTTEIMLAVVGWNETDKTAEQCRKMLSTIVNAKAKGKIKPGDPYASEVDKLQRMLELATTGKRFEADRVDLAGLRGLAGLAGLAGVRTTKPLPFAKRMQLAKLAKRATSRSLSGLGDLPVMATLPPALPVVREPGVPAERSVVDGDRLPGRKSVPDVMSSMDMMRMNYETYPFKGDWLGLIGQPSKPFKLMVWGEPGMGKSTLVMKLARYLASSFGPVLYCSSEEFPSYTLNDKVRRVGGPVPGWDFSKSLSVLEPRHKFLVLDSLNHFGWTLDDLRTLAAKRPDLSIIMILQATKDGQFKGGKDIEHEVDTVIHAYAPGQAKTTKNRFAPLSNITTF